MPNLNFLTLTIFLSDSCLFFTFVLFMLYFDDYIWFVMSVWREDYQQLSVMSHAFVFLFFKFRFLFYFTLLSFQIPFCPSLFSRSVIVQTITVTNDAFQLSHYPHLISLHAASLLCQFVFYSCSKLSSISLSDSHASVFDSDFCLCLIPSGLVGFANWSLSRAFVL